MTTDLDVQVEQLQELVEPLVQDVEREVEAGVFQPRSEDERAARRAAVRDTLAVLGILGANLDETKAQATQLVATVVLNLFGDVLASEAREL